MTQATTLCEAFQRTAKVDPDAIALRTPGSTETMTWRDYAAQVRRIAAGLNGIGIGRGDTVALMMANRIEFYPIDVGAQHLGATSFSLYNTLAPEQLGYAIDKSDTKVVICETAYVDRIRDSGATLDLIVTLDGSAPGTMTLDQMIASGRTDYDFEVGWRAVRPDDVATLIFTSGTTGTPKAVESTHANLLTEAYALASVLDIHFGDTITSFMPSAHIADRFTALYWQEVFGTQVTTVADAKQIGAALVDLRPTIWGAVPRVWEKFKAAIEFGSVNEPDPARRQGLQWALEIAAKRGSAELAGESIGPELAVEWAKADDLVLRALRARLGLDRVRWAVSGAAPIAPATLAFFAGIGVPIAEIWGMSELSCVASVSHPRDAKLGTVGRLLPGMEYRIAPDGEFLTRGPLVMKGYRNDPEKTAETVDADGWLYTGDVITVDDDGFLTIIDRKKELIINASGKNMSPAGIENAIKAATPVIGAIAVIGDGRQYNTALIVLDAESAPVYAAARGIDDASAASLSRDPELLATIGAGVRDGNDALSRVEQIKRFVVLATFWEPGGEELTQTLKLRRKVIEAKYSAEIEALYADTAEFPVIDTNAR
ncbi:fatty acid--CoA ligase FadD11 [Mycolicibacter sp. MYC340]|uniref:Acyl-CoA synthetase n=1 Tax=[Mycobacterium] nativiensis TaxID=2855503 RepID=A0ABU5XVN9_9MYCO|nr:fatty acid--CoA ligase FadD11 [Mycolicibacter sp. MYC340]MEB3031853.1 fatty acid--CoA ligase FadD11 [Mycolicibacter sp. MYC340]